MKMGVSRLMGYVLVRRAAHQYCIFLIFVKNWLVEHIGFFFVFLGCIVKGLYGKSGILKKYLFLIFRYFSLNSGAGHIKNQGIGLHKAPKKGIVCTYNSVSDAKLLKMMEVTYRDRTEAKMRWAVELYKDWREMRLDHVDYENEIFDADIDNPNLGKSDFEFALCRFICEVKKAKDQGDYPGHTLYQIVCSILNYLCKKNIDWKLVHSKDFSNFQRVLDFVMKERASRQLGTTHKQAQVISMNYENELWSKGVLGEDTPDKLCSTVLFLLGINLALRAGDEHQAL